MRYAIALITLSVMCGCAAKSPRKTHNYQFIGVHSDGSCEVNDKLTHWDAKTGALVLTCKPEVK